MGSTVFDATPEAAEIDVALTLFDARAPADIATPRRRDARKFQEMTLKTHNSCG
jgi:hypothetical protein